MADSSVTLAGLFGGAGGSGFSLGPKDNTFGVSTTTNRAAAETLRDTYATANTAWLALYDAKASNWIKLDWTGNNYVIQRRNVAGTGWEDVTNVIIGSAGPRGPGPTNTQITALVKPYARVGSTEDITVADIPASIARTTAIAAAVDNLIDGAPNSLNTLNELAAAVNDQANFASTVTNALAARQTSSQVTTAIADALEAAVTGNTEQNITVTYVNGKLNFVAQATGGGGTPVVPVQIHKNYVGIIDGELSAVTATDFTVSGVSETLELPTYTGERRLLFARPASQSDPTAVYLYLTGIRNVHNQLVGFDKSAGTIQLGGEAHNWWGTVDAQNNFGGFLLEQVN